MPATYDAMAENDPWGLLLLAFDRGQDSWMKT